MAHISADLCAALLFSKALFLLTSLSRIIPLTLPDSNPRTLNETKVTYANRRLTLSVLTLANVTCEMLYNNACSLKVYLDYFYHSSNTRDSGFFIFIFSCFTFLWSNGMLLCIPNAKWETYGSTFITWREKETFHFCFSRLLQPEIFMQRFYLVNRSLFTQHDNDWWRIYMIVRLWLFDNVPLKRVNDLSTDFTLKQHN